MRTLPSWFHKSLGFMLIFLLIIHLPVHVRGEGSYSIELKGTVIEVHLSLSVYQNFTEFLPLNVTLSGDYLINATEAVEQAIGSIKGGAKLLNFSLTLNSTRSWLNATGTFTIMGVVQSKGELLIMDLSWKSFRVDDDLTVGNFSYNLFGSKYLRPSVELYGNITAAAELLGENVTSVQFLRRDKNVTSVEAANYAGNATLFDLSALRAPISSWDRSYSLQDHVTRWTSRPEPLLDLTSEIQKTNATVTLRAVHELDAQVVVLGMARAYADAVTVDVSSGLQEGLMILSVLVYFSLSVASAILLRSKAKGRPRRSM